MYAAQSTCLAGTLPRLVRLLLDQAITSLLGKGSCARPLATKFAQHVTGSSTTCNSPITVTTAGPAPVSSSSPAHTLPCTYAAYSTQRSESSRNDHSHRAKLQHAKPQHAKPQHAQKSETPAEGAVSRKDQVNPTPAAQGVGTGASTGNAGGNAGPSASSNPVSSASAGAEAVSGALGSAASERSSWRYHGYPGGDSHGSNRQSMSGHRDSHGQHHKHEPYDQAETQDRVGGQRQMYGRRTTAGSRPDMPASDLNKRDGGQTDTVSNRRSNPPNNPQQQGVQAQDRQQSSERVAVQGRDAGSAAAGAPVGQAWIDNLRQRDIERRRMDADPYSNWNRHKIRNKHPVPGGFGNHTQGQSTAASSAQPAAGPAAPLPVASVAQAPRAAAALSPQQQQHEHNHKKQHGHGKQGSAPRGPPSQQRQKSPTHNPEHAAQEQGSSQLDSSAALPPFRRRPRSTGRTSGTQPPQDAPSLEAVHPSPLSPTAGEATGQRQSIQPTVAPNAAVLGAQTTASTDSSATSTPSSTPGHKSPSTTGPATSTSNGTSTTTSNSSAASLSPGNSTTASAPGNATNTSNASSATSPASRPAGGPSLSAKVLAQRIPIRSVTLQPLEHVKLQPGDLVHTLSIFSHAQHYVPTLVRTVVASLAEPSKASSLTPPQLSQLMHSCAVHQLAPTELLHLVSAIRSRLAHFALPDACSLLLSAARLSLLVRPRTPLAEDLLRVVLALPYTGPISVLSAKGLLAMHAAEGPAPSARQRATPSSTKQQQGQEQQQDIALSDAGKQATAGKASIALRRDYTAVAQLLTGLRTALFSAGQLHSSLLLQEHCMQAYQRLLPLVLRELHGHWSQLDAETLTALICAYRLRGGAGVSEDALRTSQVLSSVLPALLSSSSSFTNTQWARVVDAYTALGRVSSRQKLLDARPLQPHDTQAMYQVTPLAPQPTFASQL